MCQPARFLIDDGQRAAPLLFGSHSSECQRFREHPNLREWRPQLVRDAGDEVGAQPGELRFAPQLEQRGADQGGGQSEHAEDQRQPRFRQPPDDQFIGDRSAQRRLREKIAHVGADRVARRERRGVLDSGAIDLRAVAIGDDDRAHRVVLHAARERPGQEIEFFRGLDHERFEHDGLHFEAERGAQYALGIAQNRVRDIAAVAIGLTQHGAHVPRRVVDGARVHGQGVDQPAPDRRGQRLSRRVECSRLQVHPEGDADIGRERELVLHGVEVQVLRRRERLAWRHLVRVFQRLQRRDDGVVDLAGAALCDPRGGEGRVIAQHAIGLRPMIAGGPVRLDTQRRGDAEGEHQQYGDDGAASHPEATHGLKNPSWTLNRQQCAKLAGPFPDMAHTPR